MKGLIHVVRQHVKQPGWILINIVVAGSGPVAVTVHQGHINREKPQGTINVQDWTQSFLQILNGRFVQDFAQVNQISPGFVIVF